MGWLLWSEEEAMNADVNSIQMALEGRLEYVQMVHFPKSKKERDKERVKPKDPQQFANYFKEFARDHNLSRRAAERR